MSPRTPSVSPADILESAGGDCESAAQEFLLEALDAMDAKRWADVRERSLSAIAVNREFAPALLLVRALRLSNPSMFRPGDIGCAEALERAKRVQGERRESERSFAELAASQTASPAHLFLAGLWQEHIESNFPEAARLYHLASDQGVADAQFALGSCFSNGLGVAKDIAEAARMYRKAADRGHAASQALLGWCFDKGQGVTKDVVEATRWYAKAAAKGFADAQCNLGFCYQEGHGVEKNMAEAAKLYRRAAEQGHKAAQTNLGVCFENGEGVVKDLSEAAKWYRLAAEQGDDAAQFFIGLCFQNGRGVPYDLLEAARWFRVSAEQGNADARFTLGSLYESGDGVETDLAEAAKWFFLAADQGHDDARQRLSMLRAKIESSKRLNRQEREDREKRETETRELYMATITEPLKWTPEVVQMCWCKNVGIHRYSQIFEGVNGKKLLKEIDVKWMIDRGIPETNAKIAFEDIMLKRQLEPSCSIM